MHPADGSAADLRPSADGSAVRTWLSYIQCAYSLGQLPAHDRQTDGRIAVLLNAHPLYGGA